MNFLSKKLTMLLTIVAVGALVAGCGGSSGSGSSADSGGEEQASKTLKLGVADGWAENVAVSNLTKVIFEKELGYEEVEVQTVDLPLVVQGVGNGDFDAFQDLWLPNHSALLKEVEGDVEQLEPWYQGETSFSIAVPSYMNIKSIDELNDTEAKEIIGIGPGAIIMQAIPEKTIPGYGLNQELITSTEPAMLAEFEKRSKAKEDFAFIAWAPHWMNTEYDFTYLEDPKNTLVNPEDNAPLDEAKISTIVRKDLKTEDPTAYAFMNEYKLTDEQVNELEAAARENGDDPIKGAEVWLEENQSVVQPWIDAAKGAQEQAQR